MKYFDFETAKTKFYELEDSQEIHVNLEELKSFLSDEDVDDLVSACLVKSMKNWNLILTYSEKFGNRISLPTLLKNKKVFFILSSSLDFWTARKYVLEGKKVRLDNIKDKAYGKETHNGFLVLYRKHWKIKINNSYIPINEPLMSREDYYLAD